MKIGDLVRCLFQPSTAKYVKGVGCIPMKHDIKGQIGVITGFRNEGVAWVLFPHLGYRHPISHSGIEVISEST
jgi:hypothetical protein